jgi:hypothetical protein
MHDEKTKLFIKKAKEIYNDKYDYSKSVYLNSKTKITIICDKHGIFLKHPTRFLKYGCNKCIKKNPKKNQQREKDNLKRIIDKAKNIHGNKYNYDNTIFKGTHKNINVVCPIHGEFNILCSSFLKGQECQKCAKLKPFKLKSNKENLIKRAIGIYGNIYNFDKVKLC